MSMREYIEHFYYDFYDDSTKVEILLTVVDACLDIADFWDEHDWAYKLVYYQRKDYDRGGQ